MTAMPFDVQPGDPVVLGIVAAGLLMVAVVARLAPALRVTHIRPAANALRYEA